MQCPRDRRQPARRLVLEQHLVQPVSAGNGKYLGKAKQAHEAGGEGRDSEEAGEFIPNLLLNRRRRGSLPPRRCRRLLAGVMLQVVLEYQLEQDDTVGLAFGPRQPDVVADMAFTRFSPVCVWIR